MACAPSEDSDQPRHPPSLIRVFAVRMKKPWVLSCPMSAQRRLITLGGCSGWSESSLGAQVILLVLSWGGSNILYWYAQTCPIVPCHLSKCFARQSHVRLQDTARFEGRNKYLINREMALIHEIYYFNLSLSLLYAIFIVIISTKYISAPFKFSKMVI